MNSAPDDPLKTRDVSLASLVQLYDFLIRSTADGILVASPEGVIEQINPAASAMLGVTPEDALRKPVGAVFPQNAALMNLFTRSGEQTLDVRLPKRRLAVGVARSLNTGERVVLLQDVTERHELESRREALIQTMQHDMRNPISAISGFAELIAKFGDLNDQQRKFVTRIRQTTSKLYDVVGSLVELAWIEAGMPLAHRPVQMGQVIDRAVKALGAEALDRSVTIAISVQNPLPIVMGDAERIQMIVHHLLHNAVMYSDPESTVAIHAWGDDHEVYCSVADRGIGISDDEIGLVFDRMHRGKDERVRDTPGGGLGLTIARTIIQRHGGAIWAASNLGQGSTFTFLLPTVRV